MLTLQSFITLQFSSQSPLSVPLGSFITLYIYVWDVSIYMYMYCTAVYLFVLCSKILL